MCRGCPDEDGRDAKDSLHQMPQAHPISTAPRGALRSTAEGLEARSSSPLPADVTRDLQMQGHPHKSRNLPLTVQQVFNQRTATCRETDAGTKLTQNGSRNCKAADSNEGERQDDPECGNDCADTTADTTHELVSWASGEQKFCSQHKLGEIRITDIR